VIVLAGFGAWTVCAVLCLAFITLVCRRGQLEDQFAMQVVPTGEQIDEAVRHPLPASALGAWMQPRAALDDQPASKQTESV
jgi:hypothetical protein